MNERNEEEVDSSPVPASARHGNSRDPARSNMSGVSSLIFLLHFPYPVSFKLILSATVVIFSQNLLFRSNMSTAGPSHRIHHDSNSPDGHESETQRRKRKRVSGIEDVFERQDPEEKARIGKGYREMQAEAEGIFPCSPISHKLTSGLDMKANLANVTAAQLTDKLKKQSKLFNRCAPSLESGIKLIWCSAWDGYGYCLA